MSFNEAQIQAIKHFEGPALVLAGPGSGKTTVITHRTKYLIEHYGVHPSNILVVTFTKMAAQEMKQRFIKLCQEGTDGTGVTFGTFHAIFFTILKHAYHYNAGNIIREEKQRDIIRHCMEKYQLDIEDENEWITNVLSEISTVKLRRMSLENYYSVHCPKDVFEEIYSIYDTTLKRAKLLDFDDMLVYCCELFEARPDILAVWQNKYRYILVDEFQDINDIQYKIVRMLAGERANLFIVGDDDQSIYGFRGARPDIMLNFRKDYPKAVNILLNYNYRSTKQIVAAAARVIGANERRFDKVIKDSGQDGMPVVFNEFHTMDDENQFVLDKIRQLHETQQLAYSQIAVIARTNVGLRPVMGKLIEYNIPFTTRESIPNLFEHWIAKDLFAYISLSKGSRKRSDFLRVMNKPKRYISRDMLYGEEIQFSMLLSMTGDKAWLYDKINNFRQELAYIKPLNPYAAINYICKGIGYYDYLKEYAKERRISEEELMTTVGEILESSRNFDTYEAWLAYIEEYHDKLKEQSRQLKENANAVSLCTMHASKGLEYTAVIILDANEGVTPYHKAALDAELEEERRMFYVAMTRAKQQLYICAARQRFNKTQEVSRFVKALGDDEKMTKNQPKPG